MSIWEHVESFAGLPVVDADGETAPGSPDSVAWRVRVGWDTPPEAWKAALESLVERVGAEQVRALVVGDWGAAYERAAPVAHLVSLAERLVNLRGLFLGEMVGEECEISWIQQADITPLLQAYPALEVLRVRGGTGLELSPIRHESLQELALESGGLPGKVVRAVGACDLPQLRELELWLGTSEYGGDATVTDLSGILAGDKLPQLRHLGLKNSAMADEVAQALATAPVVARLERLDLSMGTTSDAGVQALLTGQPLAHLRRLNLSHHYVSEELSTMLRGRLPGVKVDLSDRQTGGASRRYVAVSE